MASQCTYVDVTHLLTVRCTVILRVSSLNSLSSISAFVNARPCSSHMANAYEGTLGLCLYNGCCKDLWALRTNHTMLAYYQSRIIARLNDTIAICGKVLRIHEAVIMR